MTKPPYKVPTMRQIKATPWNSYTVASTFSGGGGSSTGYRMAGFKVLWASEFIDAARDTYAANMASYTILDNRDIRTVKGSDILDAINIAPGCLDLLDGSPPCASFSTAGKREAGWGKVKKYSDKEQRTDDLFFEFARLLSEIQPKTFVAENVAGLVRGTAKGYFIKILKALKDANYKVSCKLLDAKWLGVPQSRQRTIFIGVRNDLDAAPVHPRPLPYCYSIAEALNGVKAKVEYEASIEKYCTGREWVKLRPGQQSGKYFNLVRADASRPSPTICASHGSPGIASVTHPVECRKFSIAELKRICGFPDDYILTGTYKQQWERCGRAVPPVMMFHIAKAIESKVLSCL